MTTAIRHLGAPPAPLTPPAPPAPPVAFPAGAYPTAHAFASAYLDQWARASRSIDLDAVERAATMLVEAYVARAGVYSCGNGGSAAIADHLQCDHLKGVRTGTDLVPRVVSLSSNVDLVTAIANDIGYEEIYAFQLQSHSRPGDVLVTISSSGRSANIVHALRWAQAHGLRTIALTGFDGGQARGLADVAVHVDCSNYGIVEDLHQTVMHAIAQFVRQSHMSAADIGTTSF